MTWHGGLPGLGAIPFFAGFPGEAMEALCAGVRKKRYPRGTVLCSPAAPARSLYVVWSGRLRISPERAEPIGELSGPGSWFGADAVLLGAPERQTVLAAEDVELAQISRACIDDLLERSLQMTLGLVGTVPAEAAPESPPSPAPSSEEARTRPRIGLALSGGGAKAFAHLGVLKVLVEARVPIDVVSGTSAGAMAAALFCADRPVPEMLAYADRLRSQILRRGGMWDFLHPPTVGLIRGERTRALYDAVLGGRTFEQLRRPLLVPAADLLTGEAVVLRTGSVSDAVRASAGIPGLFAPWPHAGRFLVEGGLVSPIPAHLLREQGADVVIGSQVIGAAAEMRVVPPDAPPPHLLRLIAARANAILDHHLPLAQADADLVIRPEVDDYDVLDYPMAEELITLGEEAARAQLPHILAHCRLAVSETSGHPKVGGMPHLRWVPDA